MSAHRFGTYATIFVLIAYFAFSTAQAGTGTNGADFLKIPIFSRGAALSGAMVANADGANAMFYNPAGIARDGSGEISFTHSELMQDLKLDNISLAIPVGASSGIGLSVTYLGYGSIAGYDVDGNPTGSLSAYSFMLGIGFSQKINSTLAAGVEVKPVFEKLDDLEASTVTFDLGMMANLGQFSFGIQYANLGGNLKYIEETVKLPATLRVGAAYQTFGASTVSVAANREEEGAVTLGAGMEYIYNSMLTFRVGYGGTMDESVNSTDGIALGMGLNIANIGVDYSYRPSSTNEGIHQITGAYHFGK